MSNSEPQTSVAKTSTRHLSLAQGASVLGIVGAVLLLTFVVDFGLQLFVAQFDNLQWRQQLVDTLIDRGAIPLFGMALIFIGTLFRDVANPDEATLLISSPLKDGKFWLFCFASLFGLVYLLLIPAHFAATGNLLDDASSQLSQREEQQKREIQAVQQQLQSIVDNKQLDQLLQQPQLPPQEKQLLETIKQDPTVIQTRTQEGLSKAQSDREAAIKKLHQDATFSRLRAELRSMLLAIAFAVLGWTGLKNVLKR